MILLLYGLSITYSSACVWYSLFPPRRRDSKRSSKCTSKSSMVKVQVSFQMSHLKRDLWWLSSTSFCKTKCSILMTIQSQSLIFSGTCCRWVSTIALFINSRIVYQLLYCLSTLVLFVNSCIVCQLLYCLSTLVLFVNSCIVCHHLLYCITYCIVCQLLYCLLVRVNTRR